VVEAVAARIVGVAEVVAALVVEQGVVVELRRRVVAARLAPAAGLKAVRVARMGLPSAAAGWPVYQARRT
jgi:hypothetical protein